MNLPYANFSTTSGPAWSGPTTLWRGFAVAIGQTIVGLFAVMATMRTRLQRT